MACVDSAKKTPLEYAKDNKHNVIIDYEKKMTVTLFSHKSKGPAT